MAGMVSVGGEPPKSPYFNLQKSVSKLELLHKFAKGVDLNVGWKYNSVFSGKANCLSL